MKNFLIFLFLIISFTTLAQDKNALQKKRSQILKEIKITNQLIAKNQESQALTSNEIKTLSKQIRLRQSLINNIDKEVRSIKREIEDNAQEIKDLEESLEALKKEYSQLIFLSYKNRNSQDRLMYIFAADDFFQAVRRVQFLKDLTNFRKDQGDLITTTKVQITTKNEGLIIRKSEKEALLTEAINVKKSIDKDKKRKEDALALINKDENKLKAQLDKQKKNRKDLQKAIEKLLAAEIKKNKSTGTTKGFSLTPEEKLQSQYFSKNKGKLPWPVEKGVIVGSFGTSAHETMAGIKVVNNGIDIATEKNSDVRAIFEGEVSGIITIPGSGMAVVVKHGEYRAVYSNLQNVSVEKGQLIDTKQEIGVLKIDGNQSTAHLEIWKITSKGMEKENPSFWIAN
ncbi:MAG: septal ring factor EnvC (AmiA/AmiB activator) [Patiriisocius sp.]|jgi:septal ring factor EnvC (AmiA/AmiB activator)